MGREHEKTEWISNELVFASLRAAIFASHSPPVRHAVAGGGTKEVPNSIFLLAAGEWVHCFEIEKKEEKRGKIVSSFCKAKKTPMARKYVVNGLFDY